MSDSEKQMIVKAILDLKQEVDRLKEIVERGGVGNASALAPVPAPDHSRQNVYEEPEEQTLEPEPEKPAAPRSVKDQKEDLFEKALARHGGNAKLAAEELGVSERTIYRYVARKKNS